nr:uncharacterized protein LOC109429266 [Aedes albopictus]
MSDVIIKYHVLNLDFKLLEDNDTTDDDSPDEATVHEEQVADENRFQEFEDQAGRDSDDLHNKCNEKIVSLENQISKLSEEIITLKDHTARLEKQNWMLQVKIVQDNDKRTLFTVNTEKDGYPSPEWLIKASTVANDSDYLFVKELMLFLWPKGIDRHATTSGRTSNNPKGAKKVQTDTEETAGPSKKASTAASGDPSVQIDPEKVNFIKDCLFQRREILGDDHGMANSLAKKAVQHINRVLANNPNMKNNNKI